MFISGVGGTGKSFLIDMIKHEVARIYKDDESKYGKCAIAAPTGLAAHNVRKLTHSDCQLNMMAKHPNIIHYRFKTNAFEFQCFANDETSMMSNLTLAYIHRRLGDLFGGYNLKWKWGSGDEWFGSVNMLFFGDLLQLHQWMLNQYFVL